MQKIFVYGTLKKGFHNNRLLTDAIYEGPAQTCDKYALYVQGLPYMMKYPQVSVIQGEVYTVDAETLRRLDILEGVPFFYIRETVEVEVNNTVMDVDCYFYNGAEMLDERYINKNGIYKKGEIERCLQ